MIGWPSVPDEESPPVESWRRGDCDGRAGREHASLSHSCMIRPGQPTRMRTFLAVCRTAGRPPSGAAGPGAVADRRAPRARGELHPEDGVKVVGAGPGCAGTSSRARTGSGTSPGEGDADVERPG